MVVFECENGSQQKRVAATLTCPLSPSLGHTVRNGAQVPAPPRLPMHGTPLPTSVLSGCSPPVPQSFFRLTSPGWEAGETSAPSRPTPSRASSHARISFLIGCCVASAAGGQLGRQAKVEILDKLRALTEASHLMQICGWRRAPPLVLRMAQARRLARVRMLPRRGVQRAAERAHSRLRMCVSHVCCAWALWAGLWTSTQQAHVPLCVCCLH